MSTTLLKLVADLELSLASAVSVGATTATLSSATDGDDVALPTGKYGFTIDADNSAKEFIVCDLTSTALTNIVSISLQGASSSGFANYHRVGALVTITDWAILSRMLNNLNGTTGFDNGTPIKYDAEPSYADPLTIPTVQYVLDTVNGGTVTFDRQIITGDAGENVSAGDWVYYNTTDGEWYKTDADDTTKCFNVRIGKAIGAGTNGNPITGGIFVSGTETVGTYVAGTTYYISNTAGELATSAGTNSVVVGVGDANGDLILRVPTPNQVDAMQGDGATPTSLNPFVTKIRRLNAGATINGATLPVPVYQNTTDNEYYACDGNDLAALKFQGFAITNGTDGNPMSIQFNGVVDGFTGLDEGVPYWLSDTVGTIQNTPGTYAVQVGVAISQTQLLIRKGQVFSSGNTGSLGTASGSTAVSCGFRPSRIRLSARSVTQGSPSIVSSMEAVWVNGAITAVAVNGGATTEGLVNSNPILYDSGNAASYMTFSITSVTNTGFTITWTETGTSAVDQSECLWEAQGDF